MKTLTNEEIINLIEDDDLRLIAKNADLGSWEWGTDDPLSKKLLMEGAAEAIRNMFLEPPKVFYEGEETYTICWWVLQAKVERLHDGDGLETEQVTWGQATIAKDEDPELFHA